MGMTQKCQAKKRLSIFWTEFPDAERMSITLQQGEYMIFRRLQKSDMYLVILIGIAIAISVAGFLGKWPLVVPLTALFRFLGWSLTACYASAPVIVSGHWLARKIFGDLFPKEPTWRVLIAWLIGWGGIIVLGMLLLMVGVYSLWVWIGLALCFNITIIIWLVRQRWQPAIH